MATSSRLANEPDRRTVLLIGYRGTGKTTIARRLAARLGWASIDADDEIERLAQQSIKQIFEREGEIGFRDREARVVADLCRLVKTVVSLGGGAVLRPENRAAIRQGIAIWLMADPQTICDRVATDPTTQGRRPNLTAAGGIEEIERLLAVREPLYRECADFSVDTRDKSPDRIVDEIVCFLDSRSGPCGTVPG